HLGPREPDARARIGVARQDDWPGHALDAAVKRRYIVGQLGQWEGRRDRLNAMGRKPRDNTRPARSVRPATVGQHNNHAVHRHLLLLTSRFCAGSGQLSVFIQLATACPISSGESSWTK